MSTTIIINSSAGVETRLYRKTYNVPELLHLLSAITGRDVGMCNVMKHEHGPYESVRGQIEGITFMAILRRLEK